MKSKFYRIQKIQTKYAKSIGISVVVGIIIITAVMIYQFNETTWDITSTDEYYEKGGKVAHVVYPDNPQFLGFHYKLIKTSTFWAKIFL